MTTSAVLPTALDNSNELTIAFLIKMTPLVEPDEEAMSASVDTVMPVGVPAVAAPIVRPERVMVNVVSEATPVTAVVMTMELPVMADVAVMVATDAVPAALAEGFVAAKNPAG